jgi:hypothetical protein
MGPLPMQSSPTTLNCLGGTLERQELAICTLERGTVGTLASGGSWQTAIRCGSGL